MAKPTRGVVKDKVVHNVAVISGFDDDEVSEASKLERDLGLPAMMRAALAPGFEKIARVWVPGARITKTECKKLKTVKASVDLVLARAGGKA